jgi:hypothetical protein
MPVGPTAWSNGCFHGFDDWEHVNTTFQLCGKGPALAAARPVASSRARLRSDQQSVGGRGRPWSVRCRCNFRGPLALPPGPLDSKVCEMVSPARSVWRSIGRWWFALRGGDRKRRPDGSLRGVFLHDPQADKPKDLDDPFHDNRIQARVAEAIARATRSDADKPRHG